MGRVANVHSCERLCVLRTKHSGSGLVWVGWGVWVRVPSGGGKGWCLSASPRVVRASLPGCVGVGTRLSRCVSLGGGRGQEAEPLSAWQGTRAQAPRVAHPSCRRPRPRGRPARAPTLMTPTRPQPQPPAHPEGVRAPLTSRPHGGCPRAPAWPVPGQ